MGYRHQPNLVSEVQSFSSESGSIEATSRYRLASACVSSGCTFWIWWASDDPSCHSKLADFSNLADLSSAMLKMRDYGVRKTNAKP
jgi:hypothetical protein